LGTIKDNLLFANKEASKQDIIDALKKANADFVQSLAEGIDTYVGSSAVQNLSGGQK